jgi:acetyl esterase/lipase
METPIAALTTHPDWYNAPRPEDPLYSPLLHPDIKLLPRVHVVATTQDPTYQETVFFYEECIKQGVEADLGEWVGLPHLFWIVPALPISIEFMEAWNGKLKDMIAKAP